MPLPIVGFGYQTDDGNLSEPDIFNTGDPVTITTTGASTLTVAQLLAGLIVASPGTTASTYTTPTGAQIDAAFNAPVKVGVSFDFHVVNIGTSTGVVTMAPGAGVTLVGLATLPTAAAGSSARWRLRKMALPSAWTLYRAA
jgi:hypothetical protein